MFDHHVREADNVNVNVEKFLHFWNQYNATLIEVLIALVLLTLILLAYKSFFGKDADFDGESARPQFAELEKNLQKIIETHGLQKQASQSETGVAGAFNSEQQAEFEKLKIELVEKESQLQELKLKVSDPAALAANAAAAASAQVGVAQAASAQTSAEVDSASKNKLEEKIKELEARLAEYEIISEDIADLSFYKEENTKLQKELDAFKNASTAQPAASAVEETVQEEPAASVAPLEGINAEQALEEMSQAAKSSSTPIADESQLMNQFENFVKKS
jgi:hypothetical protein